MAAIRMNLHLHVLCASWCITYTSSSNMLIKAVPQHRSAVLSAAALTGCKISGSHCQSETVSLAKSTGCSITAGYKSDTQATECEMDPS